MYYFIVYINTCAYTCTFTYTCMYIFYFKITYEYVHFIKKMKHRKENHVLLL